MRSEDHLGIALDACDRGTQLVRGDRHETIARLDRRLCLLVQPRVLDGLAAAAGQLFGDGQIGRVVRAVRAGRDERDRAEHLSASCQGHDHHCARIELAQHAQVLGIAGTRGSVRIRPLAPVYLRDAGAQHARDASRRRVALLQLARERLLCRVAVGKGQPADRPVRLEQVHDAPVGQRADGDTRDFLKGHFVIQRRVE